MITVPVYAAVVLVLLALVPSFVVGIMFKKSKIEKREEEKK